jgi:hypothetical protein
MRFTQRRLLEVERLETRDCPSVVAAVLGGNLVVFSVNSSSLAIDQVNANTYQITENGSTVLTRSGVTGGMIVNSLSFNNTNVTIDYHGNNTIKDVTTAFFTFGTNHLVIKDGTITGNLFVNGGLGSDVVNLGDGTTGLTVNKTSTVNLLSGTDSLEAKNGVDLKGQVRTFAIENLTLDAGSLLENNAYFVAGFGGNTYNLNGAVNGSVWYNGGFGTDSFNTGAGSTIGLDLAVLLLSGADNVNLAGSIGRNLSIDSSFFGGDKTIHLGGSVGNNATINLLGSGNDTVIFSGAVSNTLTINTGSGNDFVEFATLSSVNNANVNLGAGDDTFCLEAGVIITGTANIDGGAGGFDTFKTPLPVVPPNVFLTNFESIQTLTPC